jgi:hypothetical protein
MTTIVAQLVTVIIEFVTRGVTILMTSVRNPVYIPVCDQFSDQIVDFLECNPITDRISNPVSDHFRVTSGH